MLKRIYATSSASTLLVPSKSITSSIEKSSATIKLSNGENYTPKPGSLVTVTRAISARVNQNYDGFNSAELKKAHKTFIGRPIFVNHQNEDHRRTRGMIIDSVYKEAGQDKYIEITMDVDAKNFPRLAGLLATGELDSVSMGCDVKFTKCSYCDNIAREVEDFCDHVKYQKGKKLSRLNPKTGEDEKVLVYESCHGLNFFECSYVFEPADESAINQKVYTPKMANKKLALGELTSPEKVDTLKNHDPCPNCQDDSFDGKTCSWCEYNTPPQEFQDPDTMKSRVLQMVRQDPKQANTGKEEKRMGANKLQMALATRRLAEAQRRLADSKEETRNPDWNTDVTDIDSNPVTFDDARTPDDTADVTKLEPSAGVGKSSRKQAEFPNADPTQAPPVDSPADPSADPTAPTSDDQSDASESIADLPITWQQDESGQPYGTVDGTGLDIFVNEDKSWQVLPEGSDQPVDQGQGSSYEDAVQQAFQSAQAGGAGDPSAAAPPVDPAAAAPAPAVDPSAPVDPTKVAARKVAEGVPAAVENKAKHTDVTDLPDYETMEDGGSTYSLDDYNHNSGDDKRKLDDTTINFAPGGKPFSENNKKASIKTSAVKAAELVDLYMQFGIVPENRTAKFAAIAKVQDESRHDVLLKIALLEAVEVGTKRIASRPRNTVPRLAAKVPNMTRAAASNAGSVDLDILFGL